MDTGKKRTASDVLGIRGEKNTTVLGSATTIVQTYLEGGQHTQSRSAISHGKLLDQLAANPGIRDSVSKYKGRNGLLPPSVTCAFHYLFSMKDPAAADMFFEGLIHGVGLASGSPVLALSQRLRKNAVSKAKYPPVVLHAMVIKAWNAFRQGLSLKRLYYKEEAEKFPTIL